MGRRRRPRRRYVRRSGPAGITGFDRFSAPIFAGRSLCELPGADRRLGGGPPPPGRASCRHSPKTGTMAWNTRPTLPALRFAVSRPSGRFQGRRWYPSTARAFRVDPLGPSQGVYSSPCRQGGAQRRTLAASRPAMAPIRHQWYHPPHHLRRQRGSRAACADTGSPPLQSPAGRDFPGVWIPPRQLEGPCRAAMGAASGWGQALQGRQVSHRHPGLPAHPRSAALTGSGSWSAQAISARSCFLAAVGHPVGHPGHPSQSVATS